MMTWKQWLVLAMLLMVVAVFAVGGTLIGAYFNYVTTGIWFF